ncbi:hypothetical protein DFH09DRAFT_1336147 [Mycena vulgaris]|nr:hypothetical protein DFH09DRAFT_1336147 [Mycena vulgaris]
MLPTTHTLPSTHRAHLIRSTHKLGTLLLDQESTFSRGHTPSNSISSLRSSSSSDSKRAGRIFPAACAAGSAPEPSAPTRPHLPLSPAFTPSGDRRRKMAKLVRTLGQNVPPELVFSSAPRDSEQAPSYHSLNPARFYTATDSYTPSSTVVPALLSALSPAPLRRTPASPLPRCRTMPPRRSEVSRWGSTCEAATSASALGLRFRSASRSSSSEDK